jgi:hypothetical protein
MDSKNEERCAFYEYSESSLPAEEQFIAQWS